MAGPTRAAVSGCTFTVGVVEILAVHRALLDARRPGRRIQRHARVQHPAIGEDVTFAPPLLVAVNEVRLTEFLREGAMVSSSICWTSSVRIDHDQPAVGDVAFLGVAFGGKAGRPAGQERIGVGAVPARARHGQEAVTEHGFAVFAGRGLARRGLGVDAFIETTRTSRMDMISEWI